MECIVIAIVEWGREQVIYPVFEVNDEGFEIFIFNDFVYVQ